MVRSEEGALAMSKGAVNIPPRQRGAKPSNDEPYVNSPFKSDKFRTIGLYASFAATG